jgi:APA family basic amino acid/polyamine antiporter
MKMQLPRTLNTRDAYMLIVGNIIGIGIFTTTGYISHYLPSSGYMLLLWVVGGVLSFCGGVTYAELSSRFPMAGGDFHFLAAAYHPLMGFLFGWSTLLVTYTGSIAVIAVGFAHYFLNFFPETFRNLHFMVPVLSLKFDLIKTFAILIITIFTFLNIRGIRSGAVGQTVLTIGGILVLVLFILFGFTSKNGNWYHLIPLFPTEFHFGTIGKVGVALVGVYFTYSGWTILAYIAGEIKSPAKTIPVATSLGVITVTILYFFVNSVYLYAFPISNMENLIDIGYQTVVILWGKGLSFIFLIMILIAVLSTLNATILSGARIYFAMSQDGRLFPWAGKVHARYKSPANALWLQLVWSTLLILSGSFNQLLTYTVFVMVFFGFLSGFSLFLLRRKPMAKGDYYSAWGFPITPIIYICITGWITITTLLDKPVESIAGLVLVSLGLPFYYYWSRRYTDAGKENLI